MDASPVQLPAGHFALIWLHRARRDVPLLADELRSPDRDRGLVVAFARSIQRVEAYLKTSAPEMGESRESLAERVTFQPLLGVRYETHDAPRVVVITDIWLCE